MRWLKYIGAATVLVYRDGKFTCAKGKLMRWQLDALTDLLHAENLPDTEILISRTGNAIFSANLPAELHQRMRNILAG